MSRKRIAAGLGAAVVASAVGLVAVAPAAHAGTGRYKMHCNLPILAVVIDSDQDITVSLDPAVQAPGGTISAMFDLGPIAVSTVPFPVNDVQTSTSVTFDQIGGASGQVTVTSGPVVVNVPANTPIDPPPSTGTFTVPANAAGVVDLVPVRTVIHAVSPYGVFDAVCDVVGGANPVASYTAAPRPRQASVNPASGKPGTVVTAHGADFTPNAAVAIAGVVGAGRSTDPPTIVQTDAQGSFTGTFTVNDPNTTGIALAEVADQTKVVVTGFRVVHDASDPLTQSPTGNIKPGVLNMTQTTPGITLSEITLNGTAQTMNGKLNQVAVVDFRGSTLGWSLTGQITDFTSNTGGTLTKDKFSWTPKCQVTDPDSPSAVTAGAAADFGATASKLCTQAASTDNTVTGGQFTADADVKLAVPKYVLAGNYSATLTLSLS
ncbi:WxL domain-containing protein [Yinghuangia seranimata]|uniref:WxL domain-containing protein n=1 Tax=Yinghuangia seranimata TaxID=408067 RepID=UPI00248CEF16|nr:WxL domain-containing protein [Yinghuangia seranimata]MDI2124885.1 WxL domain-containing protein [Yinghuangia seranimata]